MARPSYPPSALHLLARNWITCLEARSGSGYRNILAYSFCLHLTDFNLSPYCFFLHFFLSFVPAGHEIRDYPMDGSKLFFVTRSKIVPSLALVPPSSLPFLSSCVQNLWIIHGGRNLNVETSGVCNLIAANYSFFSLSCRISEWKWKLLPFLFSRLPLIRRSKNEQISEGLFFFGLSIFRQYSWNFDA